MNLIPSTTQVFWTNLPKRTLAWAWGPHLGFLAIRLVRQTLKGNLKAYLGGKWEALAAWRQIYARRGFLKGLQAGAAPLDLGMDARADVLRQGWAWLRHRRSADDRPGAVAA